MARKESYDFVKREHIEKAITEYDAKWPGNDWRPGGKNGKLWNEWQDLYYLCIYSDDNKGRPLKLIFFMAANSAKRGYFKKRTDFHAHDAKRRCESEDVKFLVDYRPGYTPKGE